MHSDQCRARRETRVLITGATIGRATDDADLLGRDQAGLLLDMISDREIWQAAGAMVKRYGADAATGAKTRADELLAEGDAEGHAIWRRIMKAVEGLAAMAPGGRVN